MKISALLIMIILLACGGESHLILDSAKNYRKNTINKNKSYEVLSEGLYVEKNAKLIAIPEAWFMMGELHQEKKEYLKMKEAFNKAIEIESTREKKVYTDKIKVKLDKAYVDLYDQARAKFNSSLEASDNEKKAFLEEAKSLISTAMQIDDRVSSYILIGKVKAQLNDDSAEGDFKKALEMDAKNKDVAFDLANYYYNKKNYKKSAEMYTKVTELDPNDVDAKKFIAFSYQNDQNYKMAAMAYENYLKSNPDDAEIQEYLIQMYYMNKEYDKTISTSSNLISMNNETENVYNLLISAFYFKINDAITTKDKNAQKQLLEDAVKILEAASKKDEFMMSTLIWEALEELYARQGNVAKQKMAAKKVKELKA